MRQSFLFAIIAVWAKAQEQSYRETYEISNSNLPAPLESLTFELAIEATAEPLTESISSNINIAIDSAEFQSGDQLEFWMCFEEEAECKVFFWDSNNAIYGDSKLTDDIFDQSICQQPSLALEVPFLSIFDVQS